MLFFIIFICIFILLTLFLLIPLQFGIHYMKTTNKKSFHIYVSVFGILLRIPIRSTRKKSRQSKYAKKTEHSCEHPFTFEFFRDNVEKLGEVVRLSGQELKNILSYVRKHLSCKEIDFRIAHGTGDAAQTGIVTGAVWTSGTMLLKLIDTLIGIRKIHMDVFPDFNRKRFEVSVKAIFVMRPIHFLFIYKRIYSAIKFLKTKISNFN